MTLQPHHAGLSSLTLFVMAEQIHTVTVSVISRHVICRKVDCMPELMCGDVSVIAGQQVDSDDYIQTYKQLHCHDKNEWN